MKRNKCTKSVYCTKRENFFRIFLNEISWRICDENLLFNKNALFTAQNNSFEYHLLGENNTIFPERTVIRHAVSLNNLFSRKPTLIKESWLYIFIAYAPYVYGKRFSFFCRWERKFTALYTPPPNGGKRYIYIILHSDVAYTIVGFSARTLFDYYVYTSVKKTRILYIYIYYTAAAIIYVVSP